MLIVRIGIARCIPTEAENTFKLVGVVSPRDCFNAANFVDAAICDTY